MIDFVLGLPRIQRDHNAIWVIVNRLTKSTHFLPVNMKYALENFTKLHVDEIVKLHEILVIIISDRNSRFVS